jgi:hypothetical protein
LVGWIGAVEEEADDAADDGEAVMEEVEVR